MKKFLVIGGMAVLLLLLAVFWAVPTLAAGPDNAEPTPTEQATWDKMHEACKEGDWDAMMQAAGEVHGNDISAMPCHDENNTSPDEEGQFPSHHSDMDGGMMGGHMGNGGSMMR